MVLFHLWVPCIDIKHLGSPELFYKGEAAELNPFEETGLRVDCQLFSLTLTLHWQEQVGLGSMFRFWVLLMKVFGMLWQQRPEQWATCRKVQM